MATETKSLVQQAREQWEAKLDELRPYVNEFSEIEEALRRLNGEAEQPAPASPEPRSAAPQRRRRRSNGESRADQFVALVKENPGITVADAANRLGIQPNYLYRIAGKLHQDKQIEKEGTGYKVVA